MIMVAPTGDMATPLHQSRVLTLFLEGELSRTDLDKVCGELLKMSERGQYQAVLDLTDVAHLDYRGVWALFRRAVRFRDVGGDIKVCGASPYLAAIFRASGAGYGFEFYATPHEAEEAFAERR